MTTYTHDLVREGDSDTWKFTQQIGTTEIIGFTTGGPDKQLELINELRVTYTLDGAQTRVIVIAREGNEISKRSKESASNGRESFVMTLPEH